MLFQELEAKRDLRKSGPPSTSNSECEICHRMCRSRIGLLAHNKSHSWWWNPSYRLLSLWSWQLACQLGITAFQLLALFAFYYVLNNLFAAAQKTNLIMSIYSGDTCTWCVYVALIIRVATLRFVDSFPLTSQPYLLLLASPLACLWVQFYFITVCLSLSLSPSVFSVYFMFRYVTSLCNHLVHLSNSGGASAVKEPGHFEVRKSSSHVTWMHFFPQNTDHQRYFTIKIEHVRRPNMVTFLFSVHTITEAKQYAWRSQGGGSSSQVNWPGVPWCSAAAAFHTYVKLNLVLRIWAGCMWSMGTLLSRAEFSAMNDLSLWLHHIVSYSHFGKILFVITECKWKKAKKCLHSLQSSRGR